MLVYTSYQNFKNICSKLTSCECTQDFMYLLNGQLILFGKKTNLRHFGPSQQHKTLGVKIQVLLHYVFKMIKYSTLFHYNLENRVDELQSVCALDDIHVSNVEYQSACKVGTPKIVIFSIIRLVKHLIYFDQANDKRFHCPKNTSFGYCMQKLQSQSIVLEVDILKSLLQHRYILLLEMYYTK